MRQKDKQKKSPAHPLRDARKNLEQAERLRQAGKLTQAQKLCEEVLRQYPDYVGMLHTLGLVLADKRQYAQALPHLVQAAMLNPHDWKTLTVLAGVYLKLGARETAIRTLEQARELQPEDANICGTLGEIYRDDREYEAAAACYREAIALAPDLHEAQSGLGHSCTHLGQLEDAAKAFHELVKHRPDSINLLYALSQLPPDLINVDIQTLLDRATPNKADVREQFEASVAFTRASALFKAANHDEAWSALLRANALVHPDHVESNTYDKRMQAQILDGAKQHPLVSEKPERAQSEVPVSLFILGPSRSGKTTMEYLISSAECVKRGYENRILENAVRHTFQTAGLPTREWIAELPPSLDTLCREFYFKDLNRRAGAAKVFTNTHPGHIRSVLRIAHTIPNARFIFVKRDLQDITLRIFMKKYSEGNSYAYKVEDIQAFVSWYHEMIDVISQKLPHISAVVQYEDIIEDPGSALNIAAELCGFEVALTETPSLGDDRACSVPYRQLITEELAR